jgi:hypothetical protein
VQLSEEMNSGCATKERIVESFAIHGLLASIGRIRQNALWRISSPY